MRSNDELRQSGEAYQIRISGMLDPEMQDWFDGMEIAVHDNQTVLTGLVTDQSELHGVLKKIHDLHLTLISVEKSSSVLKKNKEM
jgi:hypothetical protein